VTYGLPALITGQLQKSSRYVLSKQEGNEQAKKTISRYCPFKVYSAEGVDARMPGHLIPYPIQVEDDGSISELPGFALFPDTTAPVSGAKSTMLPMKLTT
jgi:hypothetical protein